MEQRVNLKFLVKLGKKPTECLEMLQNVYGDDCEGDYFEGTNQFSSGISVSKVAVRMLKMTRSQDDLPHPKLQTTSTV